MYRILWPSSCDTYISPWHYFPNHKFGQKYKIFAWGQSTILWLFFWSVRKVDEITNTYCIGQWDLRKGIGQCYGCFSFAGLRLDPGGSRTIVLDCRGGKATDSRNSPPPRCTHAHVVSESHALFGCGCPQDKQGITMTIQEKNTIMLTQLG